MTTRTIKCKLVITPTTADALQVTAQAFARACHIALETSRQLKTSNKVKLQHAVYRRIRSETGLTANLAIRAIARVSAAVKVAAQRKKVVKEFKPTSVDYDQRIFAYRERDESVSLSTINGRVHIPLSLGDYQRQALKGKSPTFASVVLTGKQWFIHIVIEDADAPPPEGDKAIGVDLGINNIVTLSTGEQFSGQPLQSYKAQRAKVRASLQSKGRGNTKRVLKRLSGRERCAIRDANHVVSKRVVETAKAQGASVIRLENLRFIRSRTKVFSKHLNRMVHGWSFGQLQSFIVYKAQREGIAVEFIEPAYTSQTCSTCFSRGHRHRDTFSCPTCGLTLDADKNASIVIAAGGAAVNPPEVATQVAVSDKPTNLFVGH